MKNDVPVTAVEDTIILPGGIAYEHGEHKNLGNYVGSFPTIVGRKLGYGG